ncbi:MAG: Hsp20/alpha crystallin family protein [Pirellulales bacterium]
MATENVMAKPASTEVAMAEHTRCGPCYRPNVDILEEQEELVLLADMPGVAPEEAEIRFENGVLSIRGRVNPRQPEETEYLREEYGVGDFYRTFQISEEIDSTRIWAEGKDGVLTLHLPKTEAAKPRKISVQAK